PQGVPELFVRLGPGDRLRALRRDPRADADRVPHVQPLGLLRRGAPPMSTAVATARVRPVSREVVVRGIWRVVLYVVVVAGAILFTFPFVWMIKSSVSPPSEMLLFPPKLIPSEIVWENYTRAWTSLPFPMFYRNTVFITFLMRQYMMTIPLEMDDAARIDGCGWLQLFTRIIMPLSMPVLGVAAIYSFQYHWNAFLRPLIYLNRIELFTVPLGMAMLNS